MELSKPLKVEKIITAIVIEEISIGTPPIGGWGCVFKFRRDFDDTTNDYMQMGVLGSGWNELLTKMNESNNIADCLYKFGFELLGIDAKQTGAISWVNGPDVLDNIMKANPVE